MLCRAVDSHNSYVWTSRIFIFCARKIQKSMQILADPLERCRHSADTWPSKSDPSRLSLSYGLVLQRQRVYPRRVEEY